MKTVKSGNYPAMITPYKKDGSVDYGAVARLTKWYAENGCDGIFCDCMSNEIYFLSLEERLKIAKTVLENAPESMDVVVSGHTADTTEEQIKELCEMAKTNPKALVLIVCKLAKQDEDDEVLKRNATRIMEALPPDLPLGIYEAPLPYHRVLSPELIKWFADTGRFVFLKDTCCSSEEIRKKLAAVKGSNLKLFNANSATLLQSYKDGADGYCGVMCNYHPKLYELLYKSDYNSEQAQKLQDILGALSLVQYQMYPLNAKYTLMLEGLGIETWKCRSRVDDFMSETFLKETEQLYKMTKEIEKRYEGINNTEKKV